MDRTASAGSSPVSGVPVAAPSGEEMLRAAIARTLEAEPRDRASLFERLTADISAALTTEPATEGIEGIEARPWTRTVRTGTDGSRIFSGGVGLSIVVDPDGRLWRARTYEDFETTYTLTPTTCEVESMTPLYAQMREYVRGGPRPGDDSG